MLWAAGRFSAVSTCWPPSSAALGLPPRPARVTAFLPAAHAWAGRVVSAGASQSMRPQCHRFPSRQLCPRALGTSSHDSRGVSPWLRRVRDHRASLFESHVSESGVSSVCFQDVQVPVCPLCNSPVPVRKGELADAVVGAHMDGGCKSRPRRDEKVRLGSGGRFLRGGGGPLSPPCRLAFIVAAHGEPRTRGSGAPGSGERPGSFR